MNFELFQPVPIYAVNDESIKKLMIKSTVNSMDSSENHETECYEIIQKWFEDISKVKFVKELLHVVTQFEKLKIIFNFDSELVGNSTIHDPAFSESPYIGGTITIGAKLSSTRTEQDIKGILARELCLLALSLTYESTSNPYYSHDIIAAQNINQIIQKISNLISEDTDKSSGIISSVIESSTPDNIEMELLATVVQILVQFDDDKEELMRFEVKFKEIFDYFEIFVLTEMKNLNLKLRENVRKFNRIAGDILPCLELELSELKDVKSLTENNFSIIQTNFPKLLLINIQKSNYKNIFISSEKLQSCQELLHNLLAQDSTLNVFVTFTGAEKIDENFKNIFNSKKFTFIVSNDVQCQELAQKLTELSLNPTKVEVNYGWNDLTVDSQKLLLQMKLNFQNNSKFSFLDILNDEFNPGDEEVARNFNDIVDDQLLSLMLDGSKIVINSGQGFEKIDEKIFQKRKFVKKIFMKYVTEAKEQKMTQREFLHDINQEKFVLILDKPGSGKTWTMKNFSKIFNQENPTKWTEFVDLKQFTKNIENRMANSTDLNFLKFITDCILIQKPKFEAQIFTKLYELGKIFIFFDGLDDLDSKCAEFLIETFKTFEFNEGNQLWITSNDNFEVEIFKPIICEYSINYSEDLKFRLHVSYKFEDLKDEECVDLIAAGWGSEDISDSDQKLAMDLLNKNSSLKFGAIRMPQLCKMIAEITKNDKSATTELKELTIFREFTQMLYKNWSNLQKSGTDECKLNFWTFHELMAMQSSFPSFSDLCELSNEELQAWTDEMVASAGLMTKNGQTYNFLHSTYADFFIAEFISRTLKQEKVSNKFGQFLLKAFTARRCQCIRMFIDQGIGHLSINNNNIKIFVQFLDEFIDISHVFGENLVNLQSFLVTALKRKRYEIVKAVLAANTARILEKIKISKVNINSQIFLDFLIQFLRPKCLKKLIIKERIFSLILESCEGIGIFESFTTAIEIKLGINFVKMFLVTYYNGQHPNNLCFICSSKNLDRQKLQEYFKFLKKYKNPAELVSGFSWCGLVSSCCKHGNAETLRLIWTEFETFLKSHECTLKPKDMNKYDENIFRTLDHCDQFDIHETFWELICNTLGQEELKTLIIQEPSICSENPIIDCANNTKNPETISKTFEIFKKIFTVEQFDEIMTHKSTYKGNLMIRAAYKIEKIENFKTFWNVYENYFNSHDKFVKFLSQLDEHGNNIFNENSRNENPEIFKFIIDSMRTIATTQDIKKLLTNKNDSNCSFMQYIDRPNVFKTIWNSICEFLDASEILEILQNCDYEDENLLLYQCGKWDFYKVIDPRWDAVLRFINDHEVMSTEVIENTKTCEILIAKYDQMSNDRYRKDQELLKLKWLKTKSLRLLDCPETLKLYISQSELFNCAYDFHVLANCENFEIHEICWQFTLKKYENREDLAKLMTQKSVSGSIFIHSIMSNKNIEVIKLVLKVIEDSFKEAQIREILSVKRSKRFSLMSTAVRDSKNLQIVQILWQMYKKVVNMPELWEIAVKKSLLKANYYDKEPSYNLVLTAAQSSAEVFQFIVSEVKQLTNDNPQKFEDLLSVIDSNGQNILHVCIHQNNAELLKAVWHELKNFYKDSKENRRKFLKQSEKGETTVFGRHKNDFNILQISTENDSLEFHVALWEILWETFEDPEEIKALIFVSIESQNDEGEDSCDRSGENVEDIGEAGSNLEVDDEVVEDTGNINNIEDIEAENTEVLNENEAFEDTEDNEEFLDAPNTENEALDDTEATRIAGKADDIEMFENAENYEPSEAFNTVENALDANIAAADDNDEYFDLSEDAEIAKKKDIFLRNLLKSASHDVIRFTLENIKKLFTKMEIQKILESKIDDCILANPKSCIQTHQVLWEVYAEYLHKDGEPNINFLSKIIFNAVTCSAETFEFIWNQIKEKFNNYPWLVIDAVQLKQNDLTVFLVCVKKGDKNLLKIVWEEIEELYESQHMAEHFRYFLMTYEDVYKYPNILVKASKIDDVEFHKTLWTLLLKSYGSSENLKNGLLLHIGYYGIFMHDYVRNSDFNVNKFLIQFMLDNFNKSQIQELIKARCGLNTPNFLQNCIKKLHNRPENFKLWWEFFKKSSDNFLELLEHEEAYAFAFIHAGAETIEFMFDDLKNFMSYEKIKEILRNFGKNGNECVLQLPIRGYKTSRSFKDGLSLMFLKATWRIVHEYFNKQEILEIIEEANKAGKNLLYLALYYETVDLIDYLWSEIKQILDYREQIKYLRFEDSKNKNLYQRASENSWHKEEVQLWVKNIFMEYGIKLQK